MLAPVAPIPLCGYSCCSEGWGLDISQNPRWRECLRRFWFLHSLLALHTSPFEYSKILFWKKKNKMEKINMAAIIWRRKYGGSFANLLIYIIIFTNLLQSIPQVINSIYCTKSILNFYHLNSIIIISKFSFKWFFRWFIIINSTDIFSRNYLNVGN